MTRIIEGLAGATAALDAAAAQQAAVAASASKAHDAIATARAARGELIAAMATGQTVTADRLAKADPAIGAAECHAVALDEATVAAGAGVQAGQQAIAKARRKHADVLFAEARTKRIRIAEEIDATAAKLADLAAQLERNAADINATWTLGRPPASHKMEDLMNRRNVASLSRRRCKAISCGPGASFSARWPRSPAAIGAVHERP